MESIQRIIIKHKRDIKNSEIYFKKPIQYTYFSDKETKKKRDISFTFLVDDKVIAVSKVRIKRHKNIEKALFKAIKKLILLDMHFPTENNIILDHIKYYFIHGYYYHRYSRSRPMITSIKLYRQLFAVELTSGSYRFFRSSSDVHEFIVYNMENCNFLVRN